MVVDNPPDFECIINDFMLNYVLNVLCTTYRHHFVRFHDHGIMKRPKGANFSNKNGTSLWLDGTMPSPVPAPCLSWFRQRGRFGKGRQLAVQGNPNRATPKILNIQEQKKTPKQRIFNKKYNRCHLLLRKQYLFLASFLGISGISYQKYLRNPQQDSVNPPSHLGGPNDSRTCFSKVPGPSDLQITLLGTNILPLKLDPWKSLWTMETYINRLIRSCTVLLFLTYTVDGSEIQHSPVEVLIPLFTGCSIYPRLFGISSINSST